MKKILKGLFALRDREILNHAAALSFYSILSLIPLLFVCFSVFTQVPSFREHYERAKAVIFTFLIPAHQEQIAGYLDTFLKNSVNLGLVGLVAMAFTSLAFFSGYDFVINRITKSEAKGFWQSISSYWTLLTLVPLGLGLSFYLWALVQKTLDDYHIGVNFFEILPFALVWGLFFIAYSSSVGGARLKILALVSFGAAGLWYGGKLLFVLYVIYNKTYASVYGSFSTILFFFIWIYFSWVIYLFGVKICFLLNEKEGDKIKSGAKKRQSPKTHAQK